MSYLGNRASAARALIALALATTGFSGASAAPLTWTFQNVTFDDGGALSGFFDYDADTDSYSAFNVTTTEGSDPLFPTFNYTAATATLGLVLGPQDFGLTSLATAATMGGTFPARQFFLEFEEALTSAGGLIRVLNPAGLGGDAEFSAFDDSPPFGQRSIQGGFPSFPTDLSGYVFAEGVDVPEPALALLFGLGVAGLAVRRRRTA